MHVHVHCSPKITHSPSQASVGLLSSPQQTLKPQTTTTPLKQSATGVHSLKAGT